MKQLPRTSPIYLSMNYSLVTSPLLPTHKKEKSV